MSVRDERECECERECERECEFPRLNAWPLTLTLTLTLTLIPHTHTPLCNHPIQPHFLFNRRKRFHPRMVGFQIFRQLRQRFHRLFF